MVKVKAKGGVVDIWKKKRWHRILAPKIFNEQMIGETPSIDPNILLGRTVSVNLMSLTRDMKKQNINIIFEVKRVMGDTAFTEVKKFEIVPSSIRRFVRRGKQRIDDSFSAMTSNNRKVRIKPLIITKNLVTSSVSNAMRKKAKEMFVSRIRKLSSDILVQDIVSNRLQREIKNDLNKIYPLRICEIRMLVFEKESKKEGESAAVEEAAEPAPEAPQKAEKENITEKKAAEETEEKTEKKPKKAKEEKKETDSEEKKEETSEEIEKD
ncbi:MAG: hypothetical protein KKE20_03920 [Nanoarchaeota archaeon]|nr:hypothetical protein [Nanoarchaeota archaeon]